MPVCHDQTQNRASFAADSFEAERGPIAREDPNARASGYSRWHFQTKLTLIVALACVVPVLAQNFEVRGYITHNFVAKSGAERLMGTYDYSVRYSDGKWENQVVDRQVLSGNKQAPSPIITTFDGTDHYSLEHYDPAAHARPRPSEPATTDFGVAEPGSFHANMSLVQNLVWLAFCSADYLRSAHTGQIESPFPVSPTNRIRFNAAEFLTGLPLPKRMDFIFPGYLKQAPTIANRSKDSSETGAEQTIVFYPSPYNTGFVAAEYVVTSITNANHLQLPSTSVLACYSVGGDLNAKAQRRIREQMTLTVTSLCDRLTAPGTFQPALTTATRIRDYRFTNLAPYLSYIETNGRWLARSSPALATEIARLPRQVREVRTDIAWLPRTVMLCLCGIPALYFVVRHLVPFGRKGRYPRSPDNRNKPGKS